MYIKILNSPAEVGYFEAIQRIMTLGKTVTIDPCHFPLIFVPSFSRDDQDMLAGLGIKVRVFDFEHRKESTCAVSISLPA